MSNFIHQVADYLYQNKRKSFKDSVVVFPNRRSVAYFKKALRSVCDEHVWEPNITTISDFVQNFTPLKKASHLQLLSLLYKAYRKESGLKEPFDEFFNWGEMMLRDFDNVDKYKVDAKAIFTNTRDYKNLSSAVDFLSDDQIEAIEQFFDEFNPDKQTELKTTFLKTWDFLLPVYNSFKANLNKEGIAYEGMLYRDAVVNLKQKSREDLDFKRVYFIGFNAITRCEEEMFEVLRDLQLGSFFWDFNRLYIDNKQMDAGLFQRKYLDKFPPLATFRDQDAFPDQEINVISSPTDTGQVYQAAQILQAKGGDYQNTALVLSDELLLPTVMNYMPSHVRDFNITMGYPLKDSKTGLLIDDLLELHRSKRVEGESTLFYYKSVEAFLKHPLVKALFNDDAQEVLDNLKKENLFYLPVEIFNKNELFSVAFSNEDSWSEFSGILLNVLEYVQKSLLNDDLLIEEFKIELEFLFNARQVIMQLGDELKMLSLELVLPTYMRLLSRSLDPIKVAFEGETIDGLQVMGFLETRNVDFEHVIILSANEGQLPMSGDQPSFIPYSLRRVFSLPVREQQDAMYAYYFYRVLQRAKKVDLLYNSTASGLTSGEKSRFINQLLYHPQFKLHQSEGKQNVEVVSRKELFVDKSAEVQNILTEYLIENPKRKLSPSALTTYLTCPLKFYYGSVLYLRADDEVDEAVDARIFGNIFHHAAEYLYEPFRERKELVTKDVIDGLLKNDSLLNEVILRAFKNVIYGERAKRNFSVEGKNHLVFDVVKKYLIQLLKVDRANVPFSIIGLEKDVRKRMDFELNGKKLHVDIGGQIDRLDRTGKGVRVIDYKTGNDKLTFDKLDDVFSSEKIPKTKAVFQTFIYSMVFADDEPNEPVILPGVYQVKKFFDPTGDFAISTKKEDDFKTGNFKDVENRVHDGLKGVLMEIFDFNKPFNQTEDERRCEYCDYKDMCGR